jgi:uncharacterized membrane protein YbjE (DUF340 family)
VNREGKNNMKNSIIMQTNSHAWQSPASLCCRQTHIHVAPSQIQQIASISNVCVYIYLLSIGTSLWDVLEMKSALELCNVPDIHHSTFQIRIVKLSNLIIQDICNCCSHGTYQENIHSRPLHAGDLIYFHHIQ